MLIYLSGANSFLKQFVKHNIKNILFTFHNFDISHLQIIKDNNLNAFLDSGGFSIMNSNVKINIEDYCNFLDKYANYFKVYVNLDSFDTEQTIRNQEYLEAHGFKPIPVYHKFEFMNKDYRYLIEEYCKKYDYVGLGGLGTKKNLVKQDIYKYLSFCFHYANKFNTKIHGFAITSQKLLSIYNFYSVDSTSCLNGGRFGHLFANKSNKIVLFENASRRPKKYTKQYEYLNDWNFQCWKRYIEYMEMIPWQRK